MDTVLISEVFKSVNGILKLIPSVPEKRRKQIADETETLVGYEKDFENAIVSYGPGSRSDELHGLASKVDHQSNLLKQLIVTLAKDIEA